MKIPNHYDVPLKLIGYHVSVMVQVLENKEILVSGYRVAAWDV